MKFKIETMPPEARLGVLRVFVVTPKNLKVGESFVIPHHGASNYRMAISIVQIL